RYFIIGGKRMLENVFLLVAGKVTCKYRLLMIADGFKIEDGLDAFGVRWKLADARAEDAVHCRHGCYHRRFHGIAVAARIADVALLRNARRIHLTVKSIYITFHSCHRHLPG